MSTREARLAAIAEIAVRVEEETRLPAQMLIAQWAIESRWGDKPVGVANYFGIKKADRHQLACTVLTHEVYGGVKVKLPQKFADFLSCEESCRDYAWLISNGAPYRKAWKRFTFDGNAEALMAGVARVYATDPRYAELALSIMNQANVAAAVRQARAARPQSNAQLAGAGAPGDGSGENSTSADRG